MTEIAQCRNAGVQVTKVLDFGKERSGFFKKIHIQKKYSWIFIIFLH